ncbi:MAG: hypothetical protein J4473_05200 [Candidatus Aenigmarchaeota archaeon]|nr:hypothetical protein [Candidatus Aenigmarchaeota archaeon]
MKRSEIIIREFSLKGKKIITAAELKNVCDRYSFDFRKTKVVLLNKGYLVTIFRGIYYLKDYNEKKTDVIKYFANELLSLGLAAKGVKNWYFGLNTALKLLNVTHETFAVNYVLNDKFNRMMPIEVLGSKFLFKKIKTPLFSFGLKEIKTSNNIIVKYSDIEKTLLDMAYLYRLSGNTENAILPLIKEYRSEINISKMLSYSKNYPATIRNMIIGALE